MDVIIKKLAVEQLSNESLEKIVIAKVHVISKVLEIAETVKQLFFFHLIEVSDSHI